MNSSRLILLDGIPRLVISEVMLSTNCLEPQMYISASSWISFSKKSALIRGEVFVWMTVVLNWLSNLGKHICEAVRTL